MSSIMWAQVAGKVTRTAGAVSWEDAAAAYAESLDAGTLVLPDREGGSTPTITWSVPTSPQLYLDLDEGDQESDPFRRLAAEVRLLVQVDGNLDDDDPYWMEVVKVIFADLDAKTFTTGDATFDVDAEEVSIGFYVWNGQVESPEPSQF